MNKQNIKSKSIKSQEVLSQVLNTLPLYDRIQFGPARGREPLARQALVRSLREVIEESVKAAGRDVRMEEILRDAWMRLAHRKEILDRAVSVMLKDLIHPAFKSVRSKPASTRRQEEAAELIKRYAAAEGIKWNGILT